MKAYVYRSGHVMIGPSVPAGAIELAEWDNEAELLMICRWLFPMVEDAEGCPVMVATPVMRRADQSEELALPAIENSRIKLSRSLKDLRSHPCGPILFHVGTLERWSPESVEASK